MDWVGATGGADVRVEAQLIEAQLTDTGCGRAGPRDGVSFDAQAAPQRVSDLRVVVNNQHMLG